MKQSKNHGTPNQQPQPLYTPLLAYYYEINSLFWNDPTCRYCI
jgi:hypothetical protein